MIKTEILIGDPEIPHSILGDGKHGSAGNAAYGNKPVIYLVWSPASGASPPIAEAIRQTISVGGWKTGLRRRLGLGRSVRLLSPPARGSGLSVGRQFSPPAR